MGNPDILAQTPEGEAMEAEIGFQLIACHAPDIPRATASRKLFLAQRIFLLHHN